MLPIHALFTAYVAEDTPLHSKQCIVTAVTTYVYIGTLHELYINMQLSAYIHKRVLHVVYTGCPRRKGPNFGRVFLRSNYTDITQNTYIQSSMITEILNIEK